MRIDLTSKVTFQLLSRCNLETSGQVELEKSASLIKPHHGNDGKVILSLPDHTSSNLTDRFFYKAQNLRADFRDTQFEIDILTSRDYLFQYPMDVYFKYVVPAHELEQKVVDSVKNGIYEDIITLQFKESIVAMARTALRDIDDKDTLEAVLFLLNVAQSGKKIVVVYSHGSTEHQSGRWKLTGFNEPVYVDDVIECLSEEYTDGQIGAIYFISCNKDNLPVQPTRLPVIIHTDDSITSFQGDFNAPAKVYWPSEI